MRSDAIRTWTLPAGAAAAANARAASGLKATVRGKTTVRAAETTRKRARLIDISAWGAGARRRRDTLGYGRHRNSGFPERLEVIPPPSSNAVADRFRAPKGHCRQLSTRVRRGACFFLPPRLRTRSFSFSQHRSSDMAAAAAKPAPVVGPSMRDFTILQALGKGSYGSVFKAVRKSDGFKCVTSPPSCPVGLRPPSPRCFPLQLRNKGGQHSQAQPAREVRPARWLCATDAWSHAAVRTPLYCREDALNEIRILASIKHRNIIRYCDAFTEKDNLYIVMEFAEHGDIGRQVRRRSRGLSLPTRPTVPQSHVRAD